MSNETTGRGQPFVPDLYPEMLEANDQKIRRIVAVVDDVSDPAINQALLSKLRPRLALLKPVRPMRVARLLFMPFDPLIVPMRDWRAGDPAIPRCVLAPIALVVRGGLGGVAPYLDKIIAAHKADAAQAITQAGDVLWPRAAEILDIAPPPSDWAETGLPLSDFAALAASMAAVLRRAPQLRSLARAEEVGALETDDAAVNDILRDIVNEPEVGCAMIARLILVRSPQAAQLLSQIVASGRGMDEKALMRRAIDSGTEAALAHMEREAGFDDGIGHCALADAGAEVERVITFLKAIETNPSSANRRSRLKPIRQRLGQVCHERFVRGVRDSLVKPLTAASGPLPGEVQIELETCARDLRKLDAAARKIAGPGDYGQMLQEAAEQVRVAAEAGTLTPMRQCRLIEILAGPEAAEAAYVKAFAGG